jgi:hypothetical protein
VIHAGSIASNTSGGGGGGGAPASVAFNPDGGTISVATSVNITVTGATRHRHKKNNLAWVTVESSSSTVSVSPGTTLYADALSATGAILASDSALYAADFPDGGNG